MTAFWNLNQENLLAINSEKEQHYVIHKSQGIGFGKQKLLKQYFYIPVYLSWCHNRKYSNTSSTVFNYQYSYGRNAKL